MKSLFAKGRYSKAIFLIPLLIAFFVGQLIIKSYVFSIGIVLGLPALYFIKINPELGILAIVILISSIIFEDALPLIPIGVGSFHIPDAILLCLLFLIPLNLFADKKFYIVKTPLDIPLLLFYLAVVLAALNAVFYCNLKFNDTMRILRCLTYYLLFFVVTNLIRSEKQVRLLFNGLCLIGVGVSLAMLTQAIVGESMQLMPGRVEAAGTFQKTYDATRVLPPGEALVYVLFITSACLIVYKEKLSLMVWRYLLLLSTGIGIALTYNRSYWGSSIFCFTVLMAFANSKVKKRIAAMFFIWSIPLIVFSLVLLLSNFRSTGDGTISAMSERFSSIFTGSKVYKSSSLEGRKVENRYALQKIAKNPFLGIGLGNDYRPQIFYGDDFYRTKYIHNGYLYILLNTGLMGLLPLMWFFIRFLIRGFRNRNKIKDTHMRALLTGFTLSGLGILLVNNVSPMFQQWYSIALISVSFGLGEVIIRLNKQAVENPK